jgi:hypothetical protein
MAHLTYFPCNLSQRDSPDPVATGPGAASIYRCSGLLPASEANAVLFLRMLVCGLAVTVRILAMRLSRASVHFRLFVLALIVVMGCFAVVMGRRFVLRSRRLVMRAVSVFCSRSHSRISCKRTSLTFRGEMPV